MKKKPQVKALRLKQLGIETNKSTIIYVSDRCGVCKLKGFQPGIRIRIAINHRFIIATLNVIRSRILKANEAGLSEYAWELLEAKEGDEISLSYPGPLDSLGYIRGKIHGKKFNQYTIREVIKDVVTGRLSDIHISSFLSVCAGGHLNEKEMTLLAKAMVDVGKVIKWPQRMVVDKHCVGGIPGNRTTMIVVPIVAAFGLTIPKTSSRSITSSAGTADTMEILAPVDLSFNKIKDVVRREKGCIAWGGTSSLSPADDVLIKIERELDLDSRGQLVASILSKKKAAGSNYLLIDIPIGPTAKIRSKVEAKKLKSILERVGKNLGMHVKVVFTSGIQPVGYGIGPVLEARDVLNVLKNSKKAHPELRDRSLMLAGHILEFSPKVKAGAGKNIAKQILESGKAWKKFQAICKAQGGIRKLPRKAAYVYTYLAGKKGKVVSIDNRRIARLSKSAGAPFDKAAGIDLHVMVGSIVKKGQPLLTIHAESEGELDYALSYLRKNKKYLIEQKS